jgi:hypothetical protein
MSVSASNQNLKAGGGGDSRCGLLSGEVEPGCWEWWLIWEGAGGEVASPEPEDDREDLEMEDKQRTTGATFGSRPSYPAEHRAGGSAVGWGAL